MSTGYDGPDKEPEPLTIIFELSQYNRQYAMTGILCSITRAGEPVGIVRVQSEEEFEWLKDRMDGEFDPELPT